MRPRFTRCARALWHLSVVWLRSFATQFSDDFPCVKFFSLVTSARKSFEGLLKLLGWSLAEGDLKEFLSSQFQPNLDGVLEVSGPQEAR
jgi:hypothetical protein